MEREADGSNTERHAKLDSSGPQLPATLSAYTQHTGDRCRAWEALLSLCCCDLCLLTRLFQVVLLFLFLVAKKDESQIF